MLCMLYMTLYSVDSGTDTRIEISVLRYVIGSCVVLCTRAFLCANSRHIGTRPIDTEIDKVHRTFLQLNSIEPMSVTALSC